MWTRNRIWRIAYKTHKRTQRSKIKYSFENKRANHASRSIASLQDLLVPWYSTRKYEELARPLLWIMIISLYTTDDLSFLIPLPWLLYLTSSSVVIHCDISFSKN